MQLVKDSHIDFMKYRKFWILVSLALVVFGIFAALFTDWIRFGIDFEGGTEVKVLFKDQPPIDDLRQAIERAGIHDPLIQRFGDSDSKEVLIKTPILKGAEEGSRDRIVAALNGRFNKDAGGKPDLNALGADAIIELLTRLDPDGVAGQGAEAANAHYSEVADKVLAERRKAGILTDWDALAKADGVGAKVVNALRSQARLGDFSIIGVENVGPQIGKELRKQGFWAVAFSLLGMLLYIAFRFELRFGIGAVMASLHDIIVTIGLFALFKHEFNLTTVAAFLTLVGYSVNDTVVIFDRIRENMRKNKRKPMIETMNESLNQTLSRTILTSGLTLLTVLALLIFAGPVLRGFAFVLTVGIIVGTYSSIYVASPFALLWEQYFGSEAKARKAAAKRAASTPA
ncbi:MAG TPA: protein translocase subunit SecF [Thermoanaerobaculia bacterium]|nr:protein translocase subunit SecF [Thermoanaerobaculia bacterium]